MGVVSIDHKTFPEQGEYMGRRVRVIFKYDLTHVILGTVVRDDRVIIIRLDDGRHVLSSECQYSLV